MPRIAATPWVEVSREDNNELQGRLRRSQLAVQIMQQQQQQQQPPPPPQQHQQFQSVQQQVKIKQGTECSKSGDPVSDRQYFTLLKPKDLLIIISLCVFTYISTTSADAIEWHSADMFVPA